MTNIDIRQALQDYDLRHWQLAEALNISEFKLCRSFRHELSSEEKEKIFRAIEKLRKEQN